MGDGKAIYYGFLGGACAISSLEQCIEYTSQKLAVFQYHINKASELTDTVLESAKVIANTSNYSGSIYMAAFLGALASFFFVAAYQESQKEEKKK